MPLFWLSFSLLFLLSFCSPFFVTSSSFMASSSNKSSSKSLTNSTLQAAIEKNKTSSLNTTFIQTDPSNFKAVVHRFTGLRQETLTPHKLPTTAPLLPHGKSTSSEMGPRKPTFKLHERRLQSATKLEIMLNHGGIGGEKVMVSPVSPFELSARGSPRSGTATPRSTRSAPAPAQAQPMMDEEMRGIFEKGYYLHPTSFTPRGFRPPPLLPLFPIHARRDYFDDDDEDGGAVDNDNGDTS